MATDPRPLILHVVQTLDGGGLERTLVSLLRAFRSPRLRHAVATLRLAGSLSEQLPDDVACWAIGASGRCRSAWLRLASVARAWKAVVLHARGTGCWNDAILAGVLTPRSRVALGFHGLEASATFTPRQRRSARRGLLAGAHFTSVSDCGVRQLVDELGIPLERIDLLRNGVHPESFAGMDKGTRQRTRQQLRLAKGCFVVGTVGSLTPVKRHGHLIKAIAQLAARGVDLGLLIVGDGPLRETLEQWVQAEDIADRVRFAGQREDVPAMLACMDAYVCSSVSEGMSNALLEAMAASLPIVATNVGDNGTLLRNGVDGLIVEAESPEAIAGALATLIGQPNLRERLAGSAAVRARRYEFDRVAEGYEHYYLSLAGGRPARRRSIGQARPSTTPPAQAVGTSEGVGPSEHPGGVEAAATASGA